jgi:hypothetical protein
VRVFSCADIRAEQLPTAHATEGPGVTPGPSRLLAEVAADGYGVHLTPKHCAGSALPLARFPPPSTFPGAAWIPQPSLLLARLFLIGWPEPETLMPSEPFVFVVFPSMVLPCSAAATPRTERPEALLLVAVFSRTLPPRVPAGPLRRVRTSVAGRCGRRPRGSSSGGGGPSSCLGGV